MVESPLQKISHRLSVTKTPPLNCNEGKADSLNISVSTVKTHVSSLLLKLEADNRIKAIKKAQLLQIVNK